MADLTFGEVGKVVQLNLINIDPTQNPPTQAPLDLTNAAVVNFIFKVTSASGKPSDSIITRAMTIIFPTLGVVQYTWAPGDLVNNPNIGKSGVVRYAVQVAFNNGVVLYSNFDGQFTIKDDSIL